MYIRRTQIKSRKDGGSYYTYRLVESQRTAKGVKQHTLLNLGTHFSLPREQWPELTTRIQGIISGQQSLFELPEALEQLARQYAAQIIQSQKSAEPEADRGDYRELNLDSLAMSQIRSVGNEHASLEALRFLGLDKVLQAVGFNGPEVSAAIGTIIGRMCCPGSELSSHSWLQNESGLGELLGHDYMKTSLYRMYTISDLLLKHKETIEQYLYESEKKLFGFEEIITLYDLTNTYFEGSGKYNDLAARGHSKEKRSDCPLVTLALVLDSSGFPRRSRVFSGNVSEPGTLAEMLLSLEEGKSPGLLSTGKPTIVLDAGIATEDNITWLKEKQYHYIVVSRKHYREFNEDEAVIVKQDKEYTIKVQKVKDEENGEVLLYCHSTEKEKKEQAIQDRFIQRFEDAITKLSTGLHKKGCVKKYEKVHERLGRLKEKYSRAAKQYTITVEKDEQSENAKKIKWERHPVPHTKDQLPGVYCLRTSRGDWDEDKLWQTYTMLTDLEAVFKSLKSELGLRPVYHQKTDRVTGHLFISVLAYHLVHCIRYRLKKVGIHSSWSELRKRLRGQHRITVSLQCSTGETVHVRKSSHPEPWQKKIYDALVIPAYPGRTIKKTIQ